MGEVSSKALQSAVCCVFGKLLACQRNPRMLSQLKARELFGEWSYGSLLCFKLLACIPECFLNWRPGNCLECGVIGESERERAREREQYLSVSQWDLGEEGLDPVGDVLVETICQALTLLDDAIRGEMEPPDTNLREPEFPKECFGGGTGQSSTYHGLKATLDSRGKFNTL